MRTLVLVLGLIIGATFGLNAQTRTMVKPADLPKSISDNLTAQHKDMAQIEAFKVDTKGVITYEIIAKTDKGKEKMMYDKDGKFVKTEPLNAPKTESKATTTQEKKKEDAHKTTKQATQPASAKTNTDKKAEKK